MNFIESGYLTKCDTRSTRRAATRKAKVRKAKTHYLATRGCTGCTWCEGNAVHATEVRALAASSTCLDSSYLVFDELYDDEVWLLPASSFSRFHPPVGFMDANGEMFPEGIEPDPTFRLITCHSLPGQGR